MQSTYTLRLKFPCSLFDVLTHATHNHFMALWTLSGFSGAKWRWHRQTHQQSGWTTTPSRLIGAPTSAIPTILSRMPFLTQPSQFILAWDRHQICWLAYPVAWKNDKCLRLRLHPDRNFKFHLCLAIHYCVFPCLFQLPKHRYAKRQILMYKPIIFCQWCWIVN